MVCSCQNIGSVAKTMHVRMFVIQISVLPSAGGVHYAALSLGFGLRVTSKLVSKMKCALQTEQGPKKKILLLSIERPWWRIVGQLVRS